jgi:zinc protease
VKFGMLFLMAAALGAQTARQAPPPPGPPRPFEFPKHETKKLANGLTVYFVEDHRLPLVAYGLEVLAGGTVAPVQKAGLASLVATLLREGTAKRTSQQISKLVDDAGGSLSATASDDTIAVSASFMKSYADLGIELLADITRNPKFDQEEIDRNLQQIQSGMAVQYADASYLADSVSGRATLGTNPYAYPNDGTPRTLKNLKREDMVAFHAKYFAPGNAYLAITGDLTAEEAFAKAEKYLGDWQGALPTVEKFPAPPPAAPRIFVVDLPSSVQSQIRVTQVGIPRNHPDFLALRLGDQVFGGSFNSRVNLKLRANEGLTYGATSHLDSWRQAGMLGVNTFTRTEKTAEAIKMILDLYQEWKANPTTEAEFTEAQRFLIGSFGLSLETSGAVAGRLLAAAIHGLPEDYWSGYRQRLEGLTRDQVGAVVRRLIVPDKMTIVASGNAKVFVKDLEKLGPVKVIAVPDLDLMAPDMLKVKEVTTSTPEGAARAKKLVEAAAAAMGGPAALAGVKDMTSKGPIKLMMPQGSMNAESTELILYPDRYKMTMKLPMGEMIQAVDGSTAWVAQGPQVQILPGEAGQELTRSIDTAAALGLLRQAVEGKAELMYLGPSEFEGRKLEGIRWKRYAFAAKLYFDAATGLPAKLSYPALGAGGVTDTDTVLGDWRAVDSLKLPFTETIYQNGKKVAERTVTERLMNSGLKPALFQKPQ